MEEVVIDEGWGKHGEKVAETKSKELRERKKESGKKGREKTQQKQGHASIDHHNP